MLLLDEAAHMEQRKLLLPPLHGERMQRYGELMTEIAAREVESWPTGSAASALASDAGDRRTPPASRCLRCPVHHLVHRRPDIYPDPERFLPERFLDTATGTYSWIPFGGGVRRCVGAAFAQLEMQTVLRALVSTVRLRAPRHRDERIARRTITLTPSRRAEVIVERRPIPTRARPL